MNKLDVIAASVDLIRGSSTVDCGVVVVDKKGVVLAVVPGDYYSQVNLPKIRIGDMIALPGSPLKSCLDTGKPQSDILPSTMFGIKMKSRTYPILGVDGSIQGAISTSVSMHIQDVLYTSAHNISSTAEEMSATLQELGSTAARLAQELAKEKAGGEIVSNRLSKTGDILKFVSDIAANSNLLGLNAAIEAARAGEHGRGFAVVAEEIRKMAVNSTQAVQEIRKILRDIQTETDNVGQIIEKTSEISERQAVATEQIAVSMGILASTAVDVEATAEKISC